jgi:formylglycine-generating enzyme
MPAKAASTVPKWVIPAVLSAAILGGMLALWLSHDRDPLRTGTAPGTAPAGMVWIPGGTFAMGTADVGERHFQDAGPVHEVTITGFWMDAREVTNEEFAKFVEATGYKTVAERPIDPKTIQDSVDANLKLESIEPGSIVFVKPGPDMGGEAPQERGFQWVKGACWKHPEGPGSSIADRGQHPVVHIAWDDAAAYAAWAGKRLPTEAEWERAARGGLEKQVHIWGKEPATPARCNIWFSGRPQETLGRTAPVGSYEPNAYGLYDMAGNVWEWCSDWYQPEYYRYSPALNPQGPPTSFDPQEGLIAKRVNRGGSFLCSEGFCARYKPAGRGRGEPNSSTSHIGFRCAKDAK